MAGFGCGLLPGLACILSLRVTQRAESLSQSLGLSPAEGGAVHTVPYVAFALPPAGQVTAF